MWAALPRPCGSSRHTPGNAHVFWWSLSWSSEGILCVCGFPRELWIQAHFSLPRYVCLSVSLRLYLVQTDIMPLSALISSVSLCLMAWLIFSKKKKKKKRKKWLLFFLNVSSENSFWSDLRINTNHHRHCPHPWLVHPLSKADRLFSVSFVTIHIKIWCAVMIYK